MQGGPDMSPAASKDILPIRNRHGTPVSQNVVMKYSPALGTAKRNDESQENRRKPVGPAWSQSSTERWYCQIRKKNFQTRFYASLSFHSLHSKKAHTVPGLQRPRSRNCFISMERVRTCPPNLGVSQRMKYTTELSQMIPDMTRADFSQDNLRNNGWCRKEGIRLDLERSGGNTGKNNYGWRYKEYDI